MTDLDVIEEALKDAWRVEFVPPVLPGVVKYTIYYESADVFREWVAETRRLRAALEIIGQESANLRKLVGADEVLAHSDVPIAVIRWGERLGEVAREALKGAP